jgi:hypothetical protein
MPEDHSLLSAIQQHLPPGGRERHNQHDATENSACREQAVNQLKILGPFMVHLSVRRMSLRGFGRPSVSRSFNQLPGTASLSRR